MTSELVSWFSLVFFFMIPFTFCGFRLLLTTVCKAKNVFKRSNRLRELPSFGRLVCATQSEWLGTRNIKKCRNVSNGLFVDESLSYTVPLSVPHTTHTPVSRVSRRIECYGYTQRFSSPSVDFRNKTHTFSYQTHRASKDGSFVLGPLKTTDIIIVFLQNALRFEKKKTFRFPKTTQMAPVIMV